MRVNRVWALVCGCVGAAACGAGEARPILEPPRAIADAGLAPAELPPTPPQYVLADGSRSVLALPPVAPGAIDRGDVQGMILDGVRLVTAGGAVRAARDVADPALVSADRVPTWLGGGFFFRSGTAIYASATFDGPLRAVVTMPAQIEKVSFGPKFALVRATNGERWAIELPSGKRVPVVPTGLADVAAATGSAAAITDAGAAFVSADGGEKWTDVTAQLRGHPDRVAVLEEAVWIIESSGAALRVDADRLSVFDRPPATKPVELRLRDPRWHGDEPPIRRAIRLGAPVDDRTALVASEGDVVRVNVTTGEVVGSSQGRLPPDATCEALRAQDQIVLACTRPSGGPFVASHVSGDKALVIEQTFASSGQFYASDDGTLAFGGSCTRPKPTHLVVCVRGPGGSWQEYDLEGLHSDGGNSGVDVSRWIPRPDGSAFGFVTGPQPGVIDAKTGEVRAWQADSLTPVARQALVDSRSRGAQSGARVVDRTWSVMPNGGLRGWTDGGVSIEVAAEGAVTVSPFAFERVVTAGPFALARSREARVWQSLDRGTTWAEVAPPPTAQGARGIPEPRACSAVGCDLGTWYRVGWMQVPASASVAPTVVRPPARLARAALPVVTCRRSGEAKSINVSRTSASPDDLGLGASRLAISNESGTLEFVRTALSRAAINPPRGAGDGRDTDYGAARAVLHGPQTESGDDRFVVLAPNKDPSSLQRSLAFVAAFDPTGAIRRTQIGTTDVLAAARAAGMRNADVLREDMTALQSTSLVTPLDPAAPGDVLAANGFGLVTLLRAQPARTRTVLRAHAGEDAAPVSAAQISADEFVVLELFPSGKGTAYKMSPSGASDLFDVPAPPRAGLYPANADALALGPRNEVATLRLASGSDPPSEMDPAILSLPGSPPLALAPWSTLKTADAPECRAETGGWRATIVTLRPWVRFGGDAQIEEEAPMFARVRWSVARVCLEGIELRVADTEAKVSIRGARTPNGQFEALPPEDATLETWLVARFTGAPAAARLSIVPGFELRQAMLCSL